MANYNLSVSLRKLTKSDSLSRYILVAGSVEAITADRIFLIVLIRNCIHMSLSRHNHTKTCIKYGYIRSTWHSLFTSFDTHKVRRVMKWSKVEAVSYNLLNILSYNNRITIDSTCVKYSVTNCRYL